VWGKGGGGGEKKMKWQQPPFKPFLCSCPDKMITVKKKNITLFDNFYTQWLLNKYHAKYETNVHEMKQMYMNWKQKYNQS
jgi:hypothetical protein